VWIGAIYSRKTPLRGALSVSFADSSPKGGAEISEDITTWLSLWESWLPEGQTERAREARKSPHGKTMREF